MAWFEQGFGQEAPLDAVAEALEKMEGGGDGVHAVPARRVLRFAMGLTSHTATHVATTMVRARDFEMFLARFGPLELALSKARWCPRPYTRLTVSLHQPGRT